jgi:hypothetical protein
MFSFRDLNLKNPNRLNGFGIGLAYMVSTGIQTLRSDFILDMPAPETDLRFVDKTRESFAVLATWSFGKATPSAKAAAVAARDTRNAQNVAARYLGRAPAAGTATPLDPTTKYSLAAFVNDHIEYYGAK